MGRIPPPPPPQPIMNDPTSQVGKKIPPRPEPSYGTLDYDLGLPKWPWWVWWMTGWLFISFLMIIGMIRSIVERGQ